MRRVGTVVALLGVACIMQGTWTIWHGGTVTQFVLLGLTGMLLAAGGGYLWDRGER